MWNTQSSAPMFNCNPHRNRARRMEEGTPPASRWLELCVSSSIDEQAHQPATSPAEETRRFAPARTRTTPNDNTNHRTANCTTLPGFVERSLPQFLHGRTPSRQPDESQFDFAGFTPSPASFTGPTNIKPRKSSPSRTVAPERSPALPVPEPLPIWPVAVAQQIPTLNVETASYASSLPRPSHGEQSRFSLDTILPVDARTSDESSSMSGMRGGMGRKVSWEGGIHGALSPPPPRLSVAAERGRWTPALSVDHDDERLSTAGSATARPSMTESLPSLPRQSMSSQASRRASSPRRLGRARLKE
jgi:hypothetical protein